MAKNTVMVVDTSARAHAVAEAYARSPNVEKIIVPGNDFLDWSLNDNDVCEVINAGFDIKDPAAVVAAAKKHKIDLADVCQDDAVANGVADALREKNIPTIGPSRKAGQIEWDKQWSREFMEGHNIPQPEFHAYTRTTQAIGYLEAKYEKNKNAVFYVKASGLAAGKGAIRAENLDQAIKAVATMVHFGDAGKTFLIEECIQNHDGTPGEEASFYTITDGTNFYTFKTSQDHKAIGMFDEGPNTGGMGVISPARVIPDNLVGVIEDTIICPAIDGLRAEGRPYVGVLYTGVMVTYTVDGQPEVKVVEFNARWGAPEAEVVVPGILTPMDEIAFACINGGLNKLIIEEDDLVRVGITGASRGYPGDYSAVKGKRIFGLEEAMAVEGVSIYGAGIKKEGTNVGPIFKANGGRLFTLVGEGETIIEAREKAFKGMAQIHVDGNNLVWRTDIGHHDIQRYYEGGNNDNMDTNTRRKS